MPGLECLTSHCSFTSAISATLPPCGISPLLIQMLTASGKQPRQRYLLVGPLRCERSLRRWPLWYAANTMLGSVTLLALGDAFTSAIARVVQALTCCCCFIRR